ncbi:ROK family protein [Tessaracoccus caeni]|uniref:ROK family protein n=1 Tax=Tessaracoccus caeni TaxID=3031239 RepID=UPI0023DB6AD1|nr:ROK family protein [Tessaracoccus caeni]MDF1487217.1 ROK family protein [Tessaracoccus caeni]
MSSAKSYDFGAGRVSVGLVLDFAWGRGPFTATDVMAATGLTRTTAIIAIDKLVEARILEELANARVVGEYRAGRPARRFQLPPNLGVVVGIDSGDFHLTVAVSDLGGSPIAHRRTELNPSDSPERRRDTILSEVDAALTAVGRSATDVLAVCAGVAAPVARDGSTPPHPYGFWERTNPGLTEALQARFSQVLVKNDAQLAAAAELHAGQAAGCSDFVALLAGRRLGAGVVIDGHLLHGAHGGVGEMKAFDYVLGVGTRRGLGSIAESRAAAMLESGDLEDEGVFSRLFPEDVDARHLLKLASSGDPDATVLADQLAHSLARIVGALSSMFDPSRVIICGAVADEIDPILDTARSVLAEESHMPAPELVRSRLGADVVIRGAIITALDEVRGAVLPHLARRRIEAPA